VVVCVWVDRWVMGRWVGWRVGVTLF
jgi:hypothetical protein